MTFWSNNQKYGIGGDNKMNGQKRQWLPDTLEELPSRTPVLKVNAI